MLRVYNYTDSVYASPDEFNTQKDAIEFIRALRKRFAVQGYYLTACRERIPVKDVELEIIDSKEDINY